MANRKIPLFDLKLSAESKRQVREVMTSGWLNSGPKVREFEKEISRLVHVRNAVAVSSGTAGLQLTLEALGAGPGKEVITTPFTFVATVASILHTGATPVFADIDPTTLTIDPDEIVRKITSETLCVLSVDIAGRPADYRRLSAVCETHQLPLVADAAHSLGARVGKKSIAQLADVAVYSFQATKNLTTADGGMVLSRHKKLVDSVRLLAQHGMTATAYQRKSSHRWMYDVIGLGHKANMSDLHAAVGLGQLSVFDKDQARRAQLADRYHQGLKGLQDYLELPTVDKGEHHAWHLYIVKLNLSRLRIGRNRLMEILADTGIETGVHYRPLFEMSFYQELGYTEQYFPNAAYAGRRVMSLPLYPTLKPSDVDYICDQIARIIRRFAR
ncbi:MAG: DegT/DnrJ/EryC1/StrS family aminotransferase [candidate division Zixibacteria bacterium]|nr:DegT/DnrJ/EryC1/StrS family aminotransferase [candidate division Zixibacteria bacterium]